MFGFKTARRLNTIFLLNLTILEGITALTKETDDLAAAVTSISTAVASAVTDIQTLTATIAAANESGDALAIETAVGQLNTLTANLTSAVAPAAVVPAP